MVKLYKKNVALSALWVSKNDRLSDFYASSWQRGESPVPLLVMRLMIFLFALGILTWSGYEGNSPHWLIYLTNWGLLLVSATMLSSLAVSLRFVLKKPYETTELPWYVSLYWAMFNISVTLSILITCLFWILLYTPGMHEELGLKALWLDIMTHGLTSCLMLIELLISRTPVRLAHIYQPLSIAIWYAAFSIIYYATGGTDILGNAYIYEVLDWARSQRAGIIVAIACAALIILYLIIWTIAYCRDKLSTNFVRTRSHDLPIVP